MSSERTNREDCYICGRGHPDILEAHHIVPRRYNGSDEDPNIVELCPSCHKALERLYDLRFWTKVGALSRERTMDIIIDDLDRKLEAMSIGISSEINSTRKFLSEEYRETGYADMREDALDRLSIDDPQQEGDGPDVDDFDELCKVAKQEVRELQEEYNGLSGAPTERVIEQLTEYGIDQDVADEAVQRLRDKGEIYAPHQDTVRVV